MRSHVITPLHNVQKYCMCPFPTTPSEIHSVLKVCIIRYKICIWAAPRCVWSSPDASLSGNWAGKQIRSRQYLCTVCNKDPLLILRRSLGTVCNKDLLLILMSSPGPGTVCNKDPLPI